MTPQIESILKPLCKADFYSFLPAPLNTPNAIFTLYARNGLHAIAGKILSKNPDRQEALVPAYSCGDEIFSLQSAGFKIRPYDIETDQTISPEVISKLINPNTGLILITHFFGLPQPHLAKICEIARTRNIPLVEDCAQCFPVSTNQTTVGLSGNISVFSLRKFLPLPHGGVLLLNDPLMERPDFTPPTNSTVLTDLFIYLGQQNQYFSPGTPISQIYDRLGLKMDTIHGPRLPDHGGYNLGISNLSKFLIQNTDVHRLVDTRISTYKKMLQILKSDSVKELDIIPVHPDLLPSFLFLRVPDSVHTSAALAKAGIGFTQPFWSFKHNLIDWDLYPNSSALKKQILGVKIDPDIPQTLIQKLSLQLSYSRI